MILKKHKNQLFYQQTISYHEKIFFSHLILFSLLLLAKPQLLLAQQNTQQTNTPTNNNVPPSFKYKLKKKVPVVRVDMPQSSINEVDRYRNTSDRRNAAFADGLDIDFMKQAVSEKLPNGGKVWRLKIESNALIEGFRFNELHLPSNSQFYWYTSEGGSFSSIYRNFYSAGNFAFIDRANVIFLEYYQPPKIHGKAHISIDYTDLYYSQNNNSRDEQWYICNPDVRCNIDAPFTNGTETIIPNSPISDFKKQ